MDTWMLNQQPDDTELPGLIGALVGLIRRALEP
jgi:hypothetical protein